MILKQIYSFLPFYSRFLLIHMILKSIKIQKWIQWKNQSGKQQGSWFTKATETLAESSRYNHLGTLGLLLACSF